MESATRVMTPDVIGVALRADGGRMMTTPYAAGGGYISRMRRYRRSYPYDRRVASGPQACPFTTPYWDSPARHEPPSSKNVSVVLSPKNFARREDRPGIGGPRPARYVDPTRESSDGRDTDTPWPHHRPRPGP